MSKFTCNTGIPEAFTQRTGIPEAALGIAGKMYTDEDVMLVITAYDKVFTWSDAKEAVEAYTQKSWSAVDVTELLHSAYKRGVISLEDETFTIFSISNFFDMLNVLVMSEPERYNVFPQHVRKEIDNLYFEKYMNGIEGKELPTGDKVLTMQETLEYIDTMDGRIWLNNCDCRTLSGNCGNPLNVCISLKDGINTMPHRGWSKAISKEEAKDVVRRSNDLGLVHTANQKGICNCCRECCYLLRAQTVRKSNLIWPVAGKIAEFDGSVCVSCGMCVERCLFNAFTVSDGSIAYDPNLCRGCGLCADKCPAGAIGMKNK